MKVLKLWKMAQTSALPTVNGIVGNVELLILGLFWKKNNKEMGTNTIGVLLANKNTTTIQNIRESRKKPGLATLSIKHST